jgi:hypothetical protein
MKPSNFGDFYAYAFQYCLTGELDVDWHPTFNYMEMTFFLMIMFCYLPAPSLPPLTCVCAHSHKDTLFSWSDVDDIFRR